MKKNIKILIVGIISLIVLIGSLLLILSKPNTKNLEQTSTSSSDQLYKIFDKSLNDILSVNIKNSTGEFTINVSYEKDNQTYTIDNIISNKQASQSIIKTFMTELINLTPSKKVEETSNELNKYGLEKPNSTLKVTFKDKSYKILSLGNEAPLSLGNYLILDSEKTVYLLDTSNTEIFTNSKDYYLEDKT